MLCDATSYASDIFDHNAELFEISHPKRKNRPTSCSTINVEKEDTVKSVSDGNSRVKPYLASVSEENVVAESDLTSYKSILEYTDSSSKSISTDDASTTMTNLVPGSEENVVAKSTLKSLSSDM